MRNIAVLLVLLMTSCSSRKEAGHVFDYFHQEKPKEIPQIFAPNVVSVQGRFEMGFTISPNGKSIAFGVAHESDPSATCIYLMNFDNGKWSIPDKTFLPDNINTFFPMFDPTGKEFYFVKSIENLETDIWVASRLKNAITNPRPLNSVINSESREAGHGKSKSGSFYFTSNRDDKYQCCGDIFMSELSEGGYLSTKRVEALNSGADEESLFLSPDEDYIIIQAWKQEFDSKHDLYISYKSKNGLWTKPERLDTAINGKEIEQRPFVSPDNKYLFFSRMHVVSENGQEIYESDIYWVSTRSVFGPYPYNVVSMPEISFNKPFEIQLPDDLFRDVNGAIVSYGVSLEYEDKLPEWINFDEKKLLLTGIWESEVSRDVVITAYDDDGNKGVVNIPVTVKNN
ncbi:hypothetical protein QQ020_12575 [Fulvivirgaceae bacterium BMA12]|uniref:WD40-like Beta Propeller Repeat n=1 Tax=Agaribacillus aureus TaxID=3051825 RepID=A0ABT8L559_9BACT|nr:hypothetical protein [Fulvivirgaceae bacterium BMA12]